MSHQITHFCIKQETEKNHFISADKMVYYKYTLIPLVLFHRFPVNYSHQKFANKVNTEITGMFTPFSHLLHKTNKINLVIYPTHFQI